MPILDFRIATTSSKSYFKKNGIQLFSSAGKFIENSIILYSEDFIDSGLHNVIGKSFQNRAKVLEFIDEFREKYESKLKFMHYAQRMDIWIFKIAAIAQYLNDFKDGDLLFLDSDCVFISKEAPAVISKFLEPARQYDLGIFRRHDTFLHPETGFLFVKNHERNRTQFNILLEDILCWRFTDLPSWTDDSLIDKAIIRGEFNALDFCQFYKLKSQNPAYESELQKVLLHLKGKRKGRYSRIKHCMGRYK